MLESRLNKDIDLWHIIISLSLQILLSPCCFTGNSNYYLFHFHRNVTSPFFTITFCTREIGYLFLSNCLLNTINLNPEPFPQPVFNLGFAVIV